MAVISNELNTAIFSGRFDPPNLGHVITILNLSEEFCKVLVVILDYPDRKGCSVETAVGLFNAIFMHCEFCVEITSNKDHFGHINKESLQEILDLNWIEGYEAVYVGGNDQVNEHIKSLGFIPVEYVPRTVIYNSTEIRNKIEKGTSLEDQYNIKIKEQK